MGKVKRIRKEREDKKGRSVKFSKVRDKVRTVRINKGRKERMRNFRMDGKGEK